LGNLEDIQEMNMHVPQSQEARAECIEILSTTVNFTSGQDSKPMISIKQDGMTGSYLLTYGVVKISKHTFYDCCCTVEGSGIRHTTNSCEATLEEWSCDKISNKMKHIKSVHIWLLKKQQTQIKDSYNTKLEELKQLKLKYLGLASKQDDYNNLKKEVKILYESIMDEKEYERIAEEKLYTGHGLFSMLLPDDFEFYCDNKKSPDGLPVYITRGVMITGTLDKISLGRNSGSLSHHLYKDYGAVVASDFVSYLLYFINCWLSRRGFSIGLEDCIPENNEIIEEAREKGYMEAISVFNIEKDPEIKERKLQNVLNTITTVGDKIAKKCFKPENSMLTMVVSGSKGSLFNLTSTTSGVGQQNVNGARIPQNYGGRSLPCYPRKNKINDWKDSKLSELENIRIQFESEGMIESSFTNALKCEETFFLNAGGREGLIETAIKTSKTGYRSRQLTKFLEDLKSSYGGIVSNTKGSIIQFCYGEDAMDPAELIKTKEAGYVCCDASHIIDRLNADYEWENKI
jgi:DNA-directed RNA polymerase III subunit RPC1